MARESRIALVPLDRTAGKLEGQVYRALRARILEGALLPGASLPSTRQLAASLGLARSTIVSAYERLKAEGYLESAAGRASRVAAIAPPAQTARQPAKAAPPEKTGLPLPLTPGVPDLAAFPATLWARVLAGQARRLSAQALGYGAPLGLADLREAILAHVAVSRGVAAEPDQVILFPSTRMAIAVLAGEALTGGRGGEAWVEEPGYTSAGHILRRAGARLVPVPVDAAGLDPGRAASAAPRLIYVTPSHQYPTGVTLSLARRLQLIEIARRSGALIIEDDYDSEFQFDGRPIAALQGIDQAGVVAYVGTLAKVLAPGLRLAYAVVPRPLLAAVQEAVLGQGLAAPVHSQAAFLEFLREGHFRAHIRRMNPVYAGRMAAFRAAVAAACGDAMTPGPGTGGLQLALWFTQGAVDDRAAAAALLARGYAPQPLSAMHLGSPRSGLLCGIAGLGEGQAAAAAQAVAETVRRLSRA